MKFETKSEIIQKRLSIISPLLNLNKEDKRVLIAQIARDQNISERTIYRYLKAYNLQGLEGLCPNYKDTKPYHKRYIRFDELIDYCKSLRKADHHLSIKRIIESAESAYPNCKGILKRSTVQRWLQKDGLDHKSLRVVDELEDKKLFLRYRKSNRLDQVQCDFKEFPRGIFIDENGAPCKIYLQICIDNYSKMVLSYSVTTNQKTFVFVECLKSMIKTFGVPKTLLMDNGAAYKNAIITRACECLGIKAKYCKPYAPELKGLIERLNYTLNDIENQLKLMKNVTYKGAIEICRARINEYNFNMLTQKYQSEQEEIDEKIKAIRLELNTEKQTAEDARKWIELIKKNTDPTELTADLLNTLIEKIVVHDAAEDEFGFRTQEIEIYYRFVGKIDE